MFGILDYLKMGAAALAGMMLCALYYEGLPVVSHIPYINMIPIVGDIAVGEKQRYASEQVTLATSQMVTKFERDTLAFQLAKERSDRLHAEQMTTEASKRAEAAVRAKTDAEQALDARIKADTDPNGGRWTEEDEKWNAKR
ncbi:hypothetical protein [Rhizobium rhizogenes]|uniref:hypothetical protein n=1 Tax=Rhizobium rhizogenes TaxID=359 RepID=UPI001F3C785F|nr:hypothetical protein [Rhizobium rhizogenes]